MRTPPIISYRSLSVGYLATMAVLLAGCGGSGSKGLTQTSPNFVAAKVPISWSARSRAYGGPSSALSVVVTFDAAGTSSQNVALEADRSASPAAYKQFYPTPQTVQTGVQPMHVRFFSSSGAQGSLVGQADVYVMVQADGTLAQANGSTLTTIQVPGEVASVTVTGPVSISMGTPTTVLVSVFDAQNDLLAISPGSDFLQVTSGTGAATIDSNGNVVGTQPGSVSLTATVDGKTSPSAFCNVLPPALTMSALNQPTNALAVSPLTGNIWATVPGSDPKYGNSLVEIDPATQKVVSTISVGSNPTVLVFSDDGKTLYVGNQGAGSVSRVDPVAKSVVSTFGLSSTGFGGSQYASGLAVQPGNPNVVALCQQDDGDTGFSSGCIYNNGVMLPDNMGIYNGEVLGFSDATTLWGSDPNFEPQSLFQGTVGPTGSTLVSNNRQLGGTFSVFRGNLYFTNGQVVSGTSGNLIGTYSTGQGGGNGIAVDFAAQMAYVIEPQGVGGPYTLESFGLNSFTSVSSYSIPPGPVATNGFASLASGHFVLADGAKIYFLQLPTLTIKKARVVRPVK